MNDTLLLRVFGNREPMLRVTDFLIDNMPFKYTKTEIARCLGISRTTLYKVWRILEEFDIVVKVGEFGRAKFYKLNKDNPIVRKLIELDDAISEYYVNSTIV